MANAAPLHVSGREPCASAAASSGDCGLRTADWGPVRGMPWDAMGRTASYATALRLCPPRPSAHGTWTWTWTATATWTATESDRRHQTARYNECRHPLRTSPRFAALPAPRLNPPALARSLEQDIGSTRTAPHRAAHTRPTLLLVLAALTLAPQHPRRAHVVSARQSQPPTPTIN
jgi:hypothetical protein